MKLTELFSGIAFTTQLPSDADLGQVTCDSRQVEPGGVFVCVPGTRMDGHDHAGEAVGKGAAAIVCQRDLGLPQQILVQNSRAAYARLCANALGNPARRLRLIGVTGTNGKTSITYLLRYMLAHCGKRAGLIGTIQNQIGEMYIPATHTTPDPAELHAMFARMAEAGCEYVVMEVSSHALDQHRLEGCEFECAIFTNLTQDHLDYHGTMENYYQAKKQLFMQSKQAVINLDDEYGRRLLGEITCPAHTFSVGNDRADFTARSVETFVHSSKFTFVGNARIGRVVCPMPGLFSVSNAMAALSCMVVLGMELQKAIEGLAACPGVPGRAEVLPTDTPFTVVRDYAHSPDGLEKITAALKPFVKGRFVVLFGCAGNRDRTKRPKMLAAVAKQADYIVLTSDNPRDEDPMQIITDALPGLEGYDVPCKVIANRYDAIEWALRFCEKDDLLLLAGKGHEDYQVLDYGTIYFDEKEIVQRLLGKWRE